MDIDTVFFSWICKPLIKKSYVDEYYCFNKCVLRQFDILHEHVINAHV